VSIPDEAVEEARVAIEREFPYDENNAYIARLALAAAAPYLQAQALRDAAADTRARGDIGKDSGIEAWDYLNWRADRIEKGDGA
jgi:hypothetical protein